MTQPDPIQLQLDPTGYIAGLGQASQATEGFSSALSGLTLAATAMPTVLAKASGHLPLATFTALAAGAARVEQSMAPLRGTSAVVGANFGTLSTNINALARQFPIGNDGARALYTTLSSLGQVSKGNEVQVRDLAKAYVNLGAATNTGPGAIAAGMTQLSRVTNTGFNVDRITKLGDSLTHVAATSGASAEGILGFSKLIAPLASASGIGTTKILGISAAFSKLGDDGSLGANAFSKMLGDLNRSVRDGSPVLANYASIVGKTQAQFRDLAKANPTEAITEVTEAISRAGANGPRILEQLGLEGPRTARVFQQLAAGGGLRKSIEDATTGYGDGSTAKAAREQFGTLQSATEKYAASIAQITEALGGPFLGAMTAAVNGLGAFAGGFAKLTESGPVQALIKGVAEVAIPGLLGLKLLGGGIKGAFAGQLITSSPVRGFLGGMAEQSGAARGIDPSNTIWGRLGGAQFLDVRDRVAATAHLDDDDPEKVTQARGRMLGVADKSYRVGSNIRSFIGGSPGGGPGALSMLKGGGLAAAMAWMQMNAESSRLASTPFNEREMGRLTQYMGQHGETFRYNQEINKYLTDAGLQTRGEAAQNTARNLRDLSTNLAGQSNWQNAGMLGRGFGAMGERTLGALDSAAFAGVKKAAGGLITGFGGPVGLGIAGAGIGYQAYQQSKAEDKQRASDTANATSFIDDYRVAMGKATQATSTLSGAMGEASKRIVSSANSTLEDVKVAAAQAGQSSKVRDYAGMSVGAVQRQLQLESSSGQIGKDELRRIQQDLFLSGFSKDQVGKATAGVSSTDRGLNTSLTGQIAGVVTDQAHNKGEGGWRGAARKVEDVANYLDPLHDSPQSGTTDLLTARTRKQADTVLKEMSTRAGARSGQYSPEYASRQYGKEIDAAVAAAYKAGNVDLAEHYEKGYQADIGLSKSDRVVDKNAVARAGGSYVKALANADKEYKQGAYQDIVNGTDQANLRQSSVATTLQGINNPLAALFDVNNTSTATKTVNALVGPQGSPEDPAAKQAALQAALSSQGSGVGQSMEQLASNTLKAANSLGDLTDANATFLQALLQTSRMLASYQISGGSRAQAAQLGFRQSLDRAQTSAVGTFGEQERTAGVQGLIAGQSSAQDQAKAILTQYRELGVARQRAAADFTRSGVYAEQDYERQVERTVEQYGIQVRRTEKNYLLQRGYQIEDFNRQRLYAQTDFNKSLRRIAEDGARAMYEPYTRIQVQQTWDPANLLGNLKEQNQAIGDQMKNLATIRKQGGSSTLIKLLGLNDPKNSQQLASIIDDTARDPAVLASLNKAADARMKLGGKLTLDKDNIGVGRQKEDFATSMERNDRTFKISLDRSAKAEKQTLDYMAEDQARTLRYMAADRDRTVARSLQAYATMTERMSADVKRADQEIVGTVESLQANLDKALKGQFVDFAKNSVSTMEGALATLRLYTPQVQALVNAAGAGAGPPPGPRDNLGSPTGGHTPTKNQDVSMPGGYDAAAVSRGDTRSLLYDLAGMSGVSGLKVSSTNDGIHSGSKSYHHKNEAIDFDGGTDANQKLAEYLFGLNNSGKIRATELIWWNPRTNGMYAIKNGSAVDGMKVYGSKTMAEHKNHVHFAVDGEDAAYIESHFQFGNNDSARYAARHAMGGILTSETMWRPGHIGGEAGHEAIIPLDDRGVTAMAEAMRRFISPEQARGIKAHSGVTYITYDHSSTHHDNRTVIENVHLKAETPRQLVAEADKIRRRGALTAPPQRRNR